LNQNASEFANVSGIATVSLPFTVKIVRTEDHLSKAIAVRSRSYGKHHPAVAEQLKEPEPADRSDAALVLLAESKQDECALGTLRIETNLPRPSLVESLLPDSAKCKRCTIAYVTRLAVRGGQQSSLVKLALFKALHRYCLAAQIDWMVVTALPPLDRQYVQLGFVDVFSPDTLVPVPWSQNLAMRVLTLNVVTCESDWRTGNHTLYKFMFEDYTPDIEIFSSVSGIWSRPRNRPVDPPDPDRLTGVFGIPII